MFKVLVLVILGHAPQPDMNDLIIIETIKQYATVEECLAEKEETLVTVLRQEGITDAWVDSTCTDKTVPDFARDELGLPMVPLGTPAPTPPPSHSI